MLQLTRRRFTVAQYDRMGRVGILTEDDRVELIDGEIIEMNPIGGWHASDVKRWAQHFVLTFSDIAQVGIQDPVYLDEHSEPQPDLTLLIPRPDFYASGHPRPSDILLLVGIADSTLAFDRGVKVPLYARAGIREVWLVNLAEDAINVYRDPTPGGYRISWTARRGESLAPEAFSGRELAVAELLG